VRELENLVERVSVCAEGDIIRLGDLPMGVRAPHLGAIEVQHVRDNLIPNDDTPIATVSSLASAGAAPEPRPIEAVAAELRSALRAASAIVSSPPGSSSSSEGDIASDEEEPTEIHASGATPTPALQLPIDLPTMLRELENAYINAALSHTGSNKKEAAKLLGMGRTTLVEKLRRRNTDASRS
jgi:sigma-54 specific flagellar transcriptional regulator A